MELSRKTLHKLIASISFLPTFPEQSEPARVVHLRHHSRQETQDLEVFVTNDLKVGCLSRCEGWPTHSLPAVVHHRIVLWAQLFALL